MHSNSTINKNKLYVIKRNGRSELIHMDKITRKLQRLSYGLNKEFIDHAAITVRVVKMLYPGVTTEDLDMHAAAETASMAFVHDDYAILAGRIMVDNLHKKVEGDLVSVTNRLYEHNLVSKELNDIVRENGTFLEKRINYALDFNYRYFGYKTLENGYLKKIEGAVAERIQHMLMRVSVGIHGRDIVSAIETYELMSKQMFTHASPTLFAAGTKLPQLSSCFLVTMQDDSIRGIYETLRDCVLISKFGGGIGINVHDVRARNSPIRSTNGTASGLEPMLRVFNNAVRHVDQGGKRKGAMAIYLEPWHADVFDFLNMKRNMGSEDKKARDLLFALWIPDLFMRRVKANGVWSLMCPDKCRDLSDAYGERFDELYEKYERDELYVRQIQARDLFKFIIETQVETGTPYMLYKDACNRKSNQQNLGTIKCSNLCAEIVEYSDPDEVAVCNIASICVNKFVDVVDDNGGTYDFERLKHTTKVVVRNLNKIIDVNYYPIEAAKASNLRHRPVGVGVQGLADAFTMLRMPYESAEARLLNQQIAETIYYGALEASNELAQEFGVYDSYEGSPASLGMLQYDMWNKKPSDLWDWSSLKERIKLHGLRNSLLVAYMPTATTAQILGNNESFEPFTNNIYVRRVLAGEFQVINRYLINDLIKLNLYNDDMRNRIIAANGSIQNIATIPRHIRDLYKTVWEMKSKNLINMAIDRGAFIDQSQSFNIFLAKPTYALLTSIHMYAWENGLKTGMYYLRTKPAADAIKFTVDKSSLLKNVDDENLNVESFCRRRQHRSDGTDVCDNCFA
ncbi:rr1 [Hemileuca sp. nucleopolyhedrovirus]|uniref:Ribonucleoside-diphosphate reductase n=1 Tax=Hemileuca sp. nucleopolyhedrovirus TaxID=1367203 RepID=S5MQL7_9ABAC|nr:rr1 [Hemileuca sp. nucleopolyhedrovirus]AGR56889.1 rr1 [Hemileuca sp. nucleopolyhedrovirus]